MPSLFLAAGIGSVSVEKECGSQKSNSEGILTPTCQRAMAVTDPFPSGWFLITGKAPTVSYFVPGNVIIVISPLDWIPLCALWPQSKSKAYMYVGRIRMLPRSWIKMREHWMMDLIRCRLQVCLLNIVYWWRAVLPSHIHLNIQLNTQHFVTEFSRTASILWNWKKISFMQSKVMDIGEKVITRSDRDYKSWKIVV